MKELCRKAAALLLALTLTGLCASALAAWDVTVGISHNDDAVDMTMVQVDPETDIMRMENGAPVGLHIFSGVGWYGADSFRLTLVRLSEDSVYLEIALPGTPKKKYISVSYEIYGITEDGFELLSAVRTDSYANTVEYVNARLEDGTVGSATVEGGVDPDSMDRAFADYGLTFDYGYHVYDYSRQHDINYTYLVTDGMDVIVDANGDYSPFPLLSDLRAAAEAAFEDNTLAAGTQLSRVYDAVTAAIGPLDQLNQSEWEGITTYTYATPAGCELRLMADADGNMTELRYFDTSLYEQKLYKSPDELLALGVSDEMTALWQALADCDALDLAEEGFTPVYTESSTETPYRKVFTETDRVTMTKEFHTITESMMSFLIVTLK